MGEEGALTGSRRFYKGAGFAVVLVPSPSGGDARPTSPGAARPWESKPTGFRGRAGPRRLRGTIPGERWA